MEIPQIIKDKEEKLVDKTVVGAKSVQIYDQTQTWRGQSPWLSQHGAQTKRMLRTPARQQEKMGTQERY